MEYRGSRLLGNGNLESGCRVWVSLGSARETREFQALGVVWTVIQAFVFLDLPSLLRFGQEGEWEAG